MATLLENANRIAQAKANIKTAIENKGVTVGSSTTIEAYPSLIGQIRTGHDVSGVTATASDVLNGKKIVNSSGTVVTGTMNNYSTSTMPRNSSTAAIQSVTDQWYTATGYGSDVQFKLNFSGYVTPETTVSQAVYGLHPEVVKAGQLIGGNGSPANGAIYGTYTSDATATASDIISGKTAYVNGNKITGTATISNIQLYSKYCDITAGVWTGATLSDSSYVELCNSSYNSTWTYTFTDIAFDISKIKLVSASFIEGDTNWIRIGRGFASGSTTRQYQYFQSLGLCGNKDFSNNYYAGGLGVYTNYVRVGFLIDNYSRGVTTATQAYFYADIYSNKIVFQFVYDSRTFLAIKTTTPKFAFTIGYEA